MHFLLIYDILILYYEKEIEMSKSKIKIEEQLIKTADYVIGHFYDMVPNSTEVDKLMGKWIKLRDKIQHIITVPLLKYMPLFNLSSDDVYKLVNGNPTQENHMALEEILDILTNKFQTKPITMKTIFHIKSEVWSNQTMIEYAEKWGDEGVFQLRATIKRMYG